MDYYKGIYSVPPVERAQRIREHSRQVQEYREQRSRDYWEDTYVSPFESGWAQQCGYGCNRTGE